MEVECSLPRVLCARAVSALGRCKLLVGELHVQAAVFVAIFLPIFVDMFLPMIGLGEQWRAAQEKARARRIADYRMSARLLRLNI